MSIESQLIEFREEVADAIDMMEDVDDAGVREFPLKHVTVIKSQGIPELKYDFPLWSQAPTLTVSVNSPSIWTLAWHVLNAYFHRDEDNMLKKIYYSFSNNDEKTRALEEYVELRDGINGRSFYNFDDLKTILQKFDTVVTNFTAESFEVGKLAKLLEVFIRLYNTYIIMWQFYIPRCNQKDFFFPDGMKTGFPCIAQKIYSLIEDNIEKGHLVCEFFFTSENWRLNELTKGLQEDGIFPEWEKAYTPLRVDSFDYGLWKFTINNDKCPSSNSSVYGARTPMHPEELRMALEDILKPRTPSPASTIEYED